MSVRSLNKAQLIGNMTRDPELRYTPNGTAVCSFGLATNRSWTTDAGEKKEETEFHRIVAWNKLAELCSQLLAKGRKVYVEGRLQTRSWTGQDGNQRQTTEIVIDDMIILDSKRDWEARQGDEFSNMPAPATAEPMAASAVGSGEPRPAGSTMTPQAQSTDDTVQAAPVQPAAADDSAKSDKSKKKRKEKTTEAATEEVKPEAAPSENINPDDIPF